MNNLRQQSPRTTADEETLNALELALKSFGRMQEYDGVNIHPDQVKMDMLVNDFENPMRSVLTLFLYARSPEIARWFAQNLGRSVAISKKGQRGCPEGSGRFKDAADFRQTVVANLRSLRQQGQRDTQKELASLWHDGEGLQSDNQDSFVSQIKRYCRTYGLRWQDLKAEARRR